MSLYGLCLGLHMPRGSLLIWCGLFIGPYRRFTMNVYACSPPASLVYFEISISTHRRLNVDCNSRIDVLWPTHTHIRAHAHLQSSLSSFCYIFVLFLMWFPSVYWSRRTGLGRRTDKEFCNLRRRLFPFARLAWHNLRKIANFNWPYGKRFHEAICVPHTHRHSLSRTGRRSGRHLAGSLPESFVFQRLAAPLVAATSVK